MKQQRGDEDESNMMVWQYACNFSLIFKSGCFVSLFMLCFYNLEQQKKQLIMPDATFSSG